ncbi:prophage protein 15 [Lactiplantibacillus plantarum]|nr:prophage protein 15 [Lactiplantibacillus plantarum]
MQLKFIHTTNFLFQVSFYSETVAKTIVGHVNTEVDEMNGYDSWLIDQEEAAEGWRDDVSTEEELIENGVFADPEDE